MSRPIYLVVAATEREIGAFRILAPAGTDTLVTGVGKAACAAVLTDRLCGGSGLRVVQIGCAGGFESRSVRIGDVVIASAEIFADEGAETAGGVVDLDALGLPMLALADGTAIGCRLELEAPPDAALERLRRRDDGFSVHVGPCSTVSTVTGTAATCAAREAIGGALAESMEGAAAALACRRLGVPFVEIRGISNAVGPRDRKGWDLDRAASHAALIAGRWIELTSLDFSRKAAKNPG